jgi:integrase
VRTGLRIGELVALQWNDVDYHGRFLDVRRNFTRGQLTTPKNGEGRRVDMSRELADSFKALQAERQLEAAANKWDDVPAWIFCNETGGRVDPDNLRNRVFYGLLATAGLRRVRIHDLRHTFASLLLQQGESPVYVKDQMGHSSIQVTVDIYGHLIPGGNKQAVDRLDGGSNSGQSATQAQPVAETGADARAGASPISLTRQGK